MRNIKIHVEFFENVLGTASANPEIHREFIASNAPDAQSMEEEVAAIGTEEVFEKGMTVFPRDKDGNPVAFDYQWKGYIKDACGMLSRVKTTVTDENGKSKVICAYECGKIKAYKKEIDGLIFPSPRMIPFKFKGEMGICQRPLRGQTAQGERIALASSESIPAGAEQDFEIGLLLDSHLKAILEIFDYGKLRGFGQWRNSGAGRFYFDAWDEDGNWLAGNNPRTKQKAS